MRVLVVDDEVPLAEAIAAGLVAEGFECDVVHDGADGLWRATEQRYAAVVLDLLLPHLNGFEVCRRLRAQGNWTPVLILTAKDGEFDLAEALDTGADDFLSKPFSFVVLCARLRAIIRRGHTPRPPLLRCGPLALDPFTGECSVGDEEVALTPREAAVLAVILAGGGGVVPKHQLLEEVWGAEFDGDPNIVDVYLGHLRRKLDRAFGATEILTVRGLGYRIVAGA